ncbi:MAG: Gfo/Idh/MocA family oxidoreductase [Elusimicrobia bacterium]|nr:Gfo/Idh/MocA family oxidoreductase [Elusimicrobiota bacterium]
MLKGAILGFSRTVETVHIPAFLSRPDKFRLAAVADADPARLEKANGLLTGVKTYARAGDMFSKEERLDFTVIDSPAARRAEHILNALGNRTHVLCEKPLCLSIKDWDRIRSEAARQNCCVFTVNALKKCPQLLTVKKALDEKFLGPVSYAGIQLLRTPAESAEGILAECGWDAACLIQEMIRKEPRSLAAKLMFCRAGENAKTEEAADIQLHFEGAAAHIHLSRKHHADGFRAVICGTRGLIELKDDLIILDIKGLPAETIRFRENIPTGPAAPACMAAVLDDFLLELADPELRGANLKEAKDCVRIIKNAFYSDSMNSAAVPL